MAHEPGTELCRQTNAVIGFRGTTNFFNLVAQKKTIFLLPEAPTRSFSCGVSSKGLCMNSTQCLHDTQAQ